jgi:membrane protein DedA with SNARE-associated domain
MFEALMLLCFGSSWPASIYKSFSLKNVSGKSLLFLWLVFIGYIFGTVNKIVTGIDWVMVFYILNGSMVFIDLVLYYRYRGNSRIE